MVKGNPKHPAKYIQRLKDGLRRKGWHLGLKGRFILGIICIIGLFGILFCFIATQSPRVNWGDSVRMYYEIYDDGGNLLERSPDEGYTYVMAKGQEPSALFDSLYGRQSGQSYTLEIPSCPSHDCIDYGGWSGGSLAWRYLRYEITILSFS